jgi:hypothetical protein
MSDHRTGIVEGLHLSRRQFIEVIVVAFAAALGIHLLSASVCEAHILAPWQTAVLGLLICLACALYLRIQTFRRSEKRNITAAIVYSRKSKRLVPMPRYEFSERLSDYLRAAFAEDQNLEKLWDREPPVNWIEAPNPSLTNSGRLSAEAAEYFLLSRLSTHLTDYFAGEEFSKDRLMTLGREDLPEVLLSNRLLELFSRPMKDRPAFPEGSQTEEEEGEVTLVIEEGGVIFEKLDLVLPKNSVVQRPRQNEIRIETDRLVVGMSVALDGDVVNLPEGYAEHYLGMDDMDEYDSFGVDVQIDVSLKPRAFLSRGGLPYHRWVDSFLETIEDAVSLDKYFGRIGWETALSVLECSRRKQGNAQG